MPKMTVKQLRQALKDAPDDATVELCIYTYNRAYPNYFHPNVSDEKRIHDVAAVGAWNSFRIHAHASDNIRIIERKVKS